jgi:hypothetical protein
MDQPNNINTSPYQDDEITLKELIGKLLEFWSDLWDKKWWIILFTIPFMVYFGYNAKKTEITYQASLTYLLNDGGGGGGGIAGILGSFGLGKGGKVNMDRIVALSKSRNIIQKVLFSKIKLDTLGNKEDYIANHIITLYKMDEIWAENKPEYKDFRFTHDSISVFSPLELSALKMLHGKIVGGKNIKNPLFTNGFNEDTGILTMSTNTVDEQLSIEMCNLAFNELKQYYVLSSTNPQKNTFEFVQTKTDSILAMLKTKEYQLARFNDQNRNLSDPGRITERRLLETEVFKLKNMYAEATKNYEIADFSLTAGTPDIVIVDEPLPPLEPIAKSLLIELIKGGLLGGLIAAGFVIGRKIVVDAMAS